MLLIFGDPEGHTGNVIISFIKLPRPKPIFTSEGNLCGGLSSWLIMITPTRWCGNGMSAHLTTPWSHKFRFGTVYITFHHIRSAGTLSA